MGKEVKIMNVGQANQVVTAKEERAIRIGATVKIKKCTPMPEVVGEKAEIVDMQIQEFDKYAVYPVWVKMLTGERKGKVYGFQYGEVEILPKAYEAQDTSNKRRKEEKPMKIKVIEQVEEVLKGVTTVGELAEIEKIIWEVKGKFQVQPSLGFWEGKTPCWEMFRCPGAVRNECPAFKYRSLPCWQIEGTYCKLYDYGAKGDGTAICEVCRVYKKWGHGEPIEIKLLGKGFNAVEVEAK